MGDLAKGSLKSKTVKIEPLSQILPSPSHSSREFPTSQSTRGQKRPRRMATASVRSYALPDSDDDVTLGFSPELAIPRKERKPREQSNLQKWIYHLTELQKQEVKKVSSCLHVKPISNRRFCSTKTTKNASSLQWTVERVCAWPR